MNFDFDLLCGCVKENSLQPVVCQIHRINCMGSLQKCFRIIAVFHNRLTELFIIARQTLLFISCILIRILKSFKPKHKVMQPSILCSIKIQHRYSAAVNPFIILIVIWNFKFSCCFCKMLLQIFNLKQLSEIFSGFCIRKLLNHLLHSTGIASIVCQKEF